MRRLFTRQTRPGRPARRRPFGVVVITILQMTTTLAPLAVLALVRSGQDPSLLAYLRTLEPVNFTIVETLAASMTAWQSFYQFSGLTPPAVLSILLLALTGARVVIIAGFWFLKRWGWVLLMVQLGLLMVTDLYVYFNGSPHFLSMLNSVLVVFYLNQREVQQAFQARHKVVEVV